MKITMIVTIFLLGLCGCNTSSTNYSKSYVPSGVGHFTFAGSKNGDDKSVASVKWTYGFQFTVDTKSINKIRLTCAPITDSTFTVDKEALNINENGMAYWSGISVPLDQKGAPWLFSTSDTEAMCEAVISRTGMPDVVEKAPVKFSGPVKAATVQSLQMAFKFNH